MARTAALKVLAAAVELGLLSPIPGVTSVTLGGGATSSHSPVQARAGQLVANRLVHRLRLGCDSPLRPLRPLRPAAARLPSVWLTVSRRSTFRAALLPAGRP